MTEPDSRAASRPQSARGPVGPIEAATGDGGITVWLLVTRPDRPQHMSHDLDELAGPDFRLENCYEAAQLAEEYEKGYRAQWHCSFSPLAHDHFAPLRLLKRLAGADFDILRYESPRGE